MAPLKEKYGKEHYEFQVRDKIIRQPLTHKSLSGTIIRKVILPAYKDWGDILFWQLPGERTGRVSLHSRRVSAEKEGKTHEDVCR